jgi:hypothetical protein
MVSKKTDDERRLLQMQSKELTLRSTILNKQAEHAEVKAAIQMQKSKISKKGSR